MNTTDRTRERGQVLPIFALFLIVLCGFAALAIDVSGALSARRFYRSAADGASLAGAQDLQVTGSRAVTSVERIRARQHAMGHLVTELGIVGGLPAACDTSADVDVTDACILPGTTFHVSIRAGTVSGPTAIACESCDPARSVQVGLRNASYQLSFANLFGQGSWSVGVNSVAGLAFGKSYAIQTLRPPKKAGAIFLVNDIEINGGSVVSVQHGDVGSNSNMNYSGGGSILNIDSGYGMFYFDPTNNGPAWGGAPSPPNQVVQKLPALMVDPNYTYPAMRGTVGSAGCSSGLSNCAPTFSDAREASCGAPGATPACTRADLDLLGCGAEVTYLQTSAYRSFMATQPLNRVYCYQPGIYGTSNANKLSAATGDVVLLMPGAYYFKSPSSGLDVGGRLLGGYRPGVPGVALMFDECLNQCIFSGNNALTIALNAGNKYPTGTAGTAAIAARDWDNQPVQTSGPSSPTPPLLITLLVNKDPDCLVPAPPAIQEPLGCDPGTHNKTINIAGGGSLALEGVQYAPTDNIEISGGSAGNGQVGQIIAYTLLYTGGTHINQEGPPSQGPGTLRLDAACTAPASPCNP